METPLTFRELEAFACLGLTWFLTLYGARVAGHEALGAESRLVLRIDLHKRTCDSEAERLGLTFVAAPIYMGVDVIFLSSLESAERLLHNILKDRRGEIDVDRTLVDNDITAALGEVDSGYGCLAAANCINFFHLLLLFQFVDIDYFGIVGLVSVLCAIIYIEVTELLCAE